MPDDPKISILLAYMLSLNIRNFYEGGYPDWSQKVENEIESFFVKKNVECSYNLYPEGHYWAISLSITVRVKNPDPYGFSKTLNKPTLYIKLLIPKSEFKKL